MSTVSQPETVFSSEDNCGDDQARIRWLALLEGLERNAEFGALREVQIDRLDVWPIIKATLAMGALNRDQRTSFVAKSMVKSVPARAFNRMVGRGSASLPKLNCDVLFLANMAPAINVDGVLVNPHLDPLRNALEERGSRTLTAYYDGPSEISNFAMASVGLSDVLRDIKSNEAPRDELRKLEELLAILLRGAALNDAIGPADIVKRVSQTLSLRSRYSRIFEANLQVNSLFLINYYGPHGWAAIAAAKSLGIPTTDIQHGVQGRFHHAYSWPELERESLSCVPDHFLSWTEKDQQNLDQYALTRGKARLIGPGHFQLERLAANLASSESTAGAFQSYDRLSEELRQRAEGIRADGKRIAGVFLQYKEDYDWLGGLPRKVPSSFELWVRRHPGVRRLDPSPQPVPGIFYVDDYPLAAVLRAIDVAVTGYSSVGIEASYIGRPIVAYSPLAKEFLETDCAATGFLLCRGTQDAVARAIAESPPPRAELGSNLPAIEDVADWAATLTKPAKRSMRKPASRNNARKPASRNKKRRDFLPDISLLEPDVVMLVANDGWDIRALKEARSLAANGLSVVLVGRQSDPEAIDRFADDFGIDIVDVPFIRNEETMRLLLERGIWRRMNFYERLLSSTLLEILSFTDFRIKGKKVPPPVHAELLQQIQERAVAGKRRRVKSSGHNPWLLGFIRGAPGTNKRIQGRIRNTFGNSLAGALAILVARAMNFLVTAPVRLVAYLYKVTTSVLKRHIIKSMRAILKTTAMPLAPLRVTARAWQKFGRQAYRYARFFLFTIEYGETVARLKPRVIHAHDLYTLQAATRIAAWTGAKVVYDAHELESDRRHTTDQRMRRWIINQEKKYAPRAAACVTVSHAIADEMASELGVKRPLVVFNAPITEGVPERWENRTLRTTLGLDQTTPLFVFVGKVYELYNSNQRVGLIIEALAQCAGFHLAIVGPVGPQAATQIEELSARLRMRDRLHVVPPIPAEAIISFISDADAGIYFMWPDTRNIDLTIPNKLFEFSLAGLPIVVSDLTSTRWFVEQLHNAILVAEKTPEAVAQACKTAYEKAAELKPKSERLAEIREEFSWEAQGAKLWTLYEHILRS